MYPYVHVGNATDLTNKKDRLLYRALEILPGFLAWGTLIIIVIVSFRAPFWGAMFVIIFDIYWLIKTAYLSILTRHSYSLLKKNLAINWLERVKALPPSKELGFKWDEVYHLVILPLYKESLEVVRGSVNTIASSNYPLDKMILVITTEEKAGEEGQIVMREIEKEFGPKFFRYLSVTHPAGLEGEMQGKGSNEAWAGRKVKEEVIDRLGIDYKKILVSVFDIDTSVPKDFFGCLTWNYLTTSKPLRSSFQPIPLFTNNIWQAPAFARVFAFSTTFWQMIQQSRYEQLVTFSSHSMPFEPLVEIGFWQKNVVSEDSRIFWQCLLAFDGDWRTIPMHYPVYMDANLAESFWKTLKNQYKQIRRWLYGAENLPYFMFGFIKNKKIPKFTKWMHTFTSLERTHSSPTNALIIFLLSWLPLWVGGVDFANHVLAFNLPRVASLILNLALFGLVASALLSISLLPPKPKHYSIWFWPLMFIQWILFPINFILFGSIPALDAQTRLMIGKYMGFWTTPKERR